MMTTREQIIELHKRLGDLPSGIAEARMSVYLTAEQIISLRKDTSGMIQWYTSYKSVPENAPKIEIKENSCVGRVCLADEHMDLNNPSEWVDVYLKSDE